MLDNHLTLLDSHLTLYLSFYIREFTPPDSWDSWTSEVFDPARAGFCPKPTPFVVGQRWDRSKPISIAYAIISFANSRIGIAFAPGGIKNAVLTDSP
jgi:hypothetical protein